LEKRRAKWQPPEPNVKKGYLARYARLVSSASQGAVLFDNPVGKEGGQMITGAEIIIKSLEEEGVEVVFGYPGGAVIPLYDKLYDSSLKHVLVRHEQAAAHAADGYARATGKTGVAIATVRPRSDKPGDRYCYSCYGLYTYGGFTGQVALPANWT